jgi:hypothetical protein
MDPLKISSVELDDRDPFRATFNVHLTRDMTDFERQTLPPLLSGGFSPSEARGSAVPRDPPSIMAQTTPTIRQAWGRGSQSRGRIHPKPPLLALYPSATEKSFRRDSGLPPVIRFWVGCDIGHPSGRSAQKGARPP